MIPNRFEDKENKGNKIIKGTRLSPSAAQRLLKLSIPPITSYPIADEDDEAAVVTMLTENERIQIQNEIDALTDPNKIFLNERQHMASIQGIMAQRIFEMYLITNIAREYVGSSSVKYDPYTRLELIRYLFRELYKIPNGETHWIDKILDEELDGSLENNYFQSENFPRNVSSRFMQLLGFDLREMAKLTPAQRTGIYRIREIARGRLNISKVQEIVDLTLNTPYCQELTILSDRLNENSDISGIFIDRNFQISIDHLPKSHARDISGKEGGDKIRSTISLTPDLLVLPRTDNPTGVNNPAILIDYKTGKEGTIAIYDDPNLPLMSMFSVLAATGFIETFNGSRFYNKIDEDRLNNRLEDIIMNEGLLIGRLSLTTGEYIPIFPDLFIQRAMENNMDLMSYVNMLKNDVYRLIHFRRVNQLKGLDRHGPLPRLRVLK